MKNRRILPILVAEDNAPDPEGAQPEPEQEFVLPENLAELEDSQLADLEREAMDAFDAIRAGRLTPESIQALSDLTTAIEALRSEAGVRLDAAADLATQADELAARVVVPDTPEAAAEATPEGEGGEAAPTPEAGGPEAETAPSAEGGDGGGEPVPAPEQEPAAVAAAAAPAPRERIRVPLGLIAAQAPAPDVEQSSEPTISMVAAAELEGITPGTRFGSTVDVARAMHSRARHLGNGHSAPIATITRPVAHRITEQMTVDQMQAVIAAAVSPDQLRGGMGLTAAGGWCAISQVLYDLFSMESTDGLFTMPTIGIERGGIQFPDPDSVPTLRDVFGTDALWLWTEQNDIDAHTAGGDDPTKPCSRIPCVSFTEERLDAYGICLTHGNLADRGYPELTAQFVNLVMAAHEHVMSVARLGAVLSDSSGVTMGSNFGAASPILGAVELQVLDIRDKYRMNMGTLMEAVFPQWVKGLIRSDLGHRSDSGADDLGVTDAQIEAWFAQRGVRPQFVYNWQSLQTSSDDEDTDTIVSDGGGDGGESTAYPESLDFLVYPAGTWLWGTGGSINLAVLRDSTLNATNDHTAAFSEEFHLVAKRGPESRVVTIENLFPDGSTGSTDGGDNTGNASY